MISNTKRNLTLAIVAAALTCALPVAQAQMPRVIKISHQFPAATNEDGDFRDRLVRRFAAEVEKQSKGSLKFEIYPGSSLMKTNSQIGALRKSALDMSLVPLAYGGGEIPQVNITLMPTVVSSYEQGMRWKTAPIGQELDRILADKNIKIITWVWQAGGIASTKKTVVVPDDAKGLKFRGGSKEMDQMLKGAGAAVTGMPSSEIYSAMQSGVLDAALTSSTSLIIGNNDRRRRGQRAQHGGSGQVTGTAFWQQPEQERAAQRGKDQQREQRKVHWWNLAAMVWLAISVR